MLKLAACGVPSHDCMPQQYTRLRMPPLAQDLMRRNLLYEDSMRWARALCCVLTCAGTLCPETARAAYVEIVRRLQVSNLSRFTCLVPSGTQQRCSQSSMRDSSDDAAYEIVIDYV